MLSLKGNPLDEDNDNLLDEVVLDRICLDELKLIYLQYEQKAMKKGIQHVLNLDEKSMSLGICEFV